jgi:acyl carrier protein
MNTQEINSVLLELAKEIITETTEPITMDQKITEIGFNSIIFIKMVVFIEDAFQFEFDDEMLNYNRYETLQNISDYIRSKCNGPE